MNTTLTPNENHIAQTKPWKRKYQERRVRDPAAVAGQRPRRSLDRGDELADRLSRADDELVRVPLRFLPRDVRRRSVVSDLHEDDARRELRPVR